MPIVLVVSTSVFLGACHAKAPTPKTSSSQDLLAQVESIEADESALLFEQAKAAAEKDNVKEADSLIQQALGRGAGSNGMVEAKAEIKKAEARIAEKKRKAENARRARDAATRSSASSSYSESYSGSSEGSEVNSITVSVNVAGTGMSESDLKLTLSRTNANFSDQNGRYREVQIYKPSSGSISGTYYYSFTTTYRQSALHSAKLKRCSGPFTVSGRKTYLTLNMSSDCSVYVQ